MEIIKEHPIQKKWKVAAYTEPGYEHNCEFTRHPYVVYVGHNGPPDDSALWIRNNFIFRATMQLGDIAVYQSSVHLLCYSIEPRIEFKFIPRTYLKAMELLRNGRFQPGNTPVFTGTFTFEKVGASMFVAPYTDP